MSTIYEKNFWKGYGKIHDHYMKRKNQFIQLNYIFSRLAVLYENFGVGLTELVKDVKFYEAKNKKDASTFDNFKDNFIQQLNSQGIAYSNVATKIKATFVDKVLGLDNPKEIYFTENLNEMVPNPESNPKDMTFPDIEAEYIAELENLEEKKVNFHNAINQQLKEHVGSNFKIKNLFQFKHKVEFKPNEKTNQYMERLKEAEKKRKDYVNYYKTLTNYYYNVEVKFIDQTKKIMNTYTEILNPLIDTLSLIARDNNFIEEIDSKKDTEKFVALNKTLGFPPFQLDLMNYTVEAENLIKDSGLKESERQEKMNIIQEFMSSVSFYVSQLNDNKKQLEPYFIRLFDGTFTEEDLQKLKDEFNKEDSELKNEKQDAKASKGKVHNYGSGLYQTMGIKNQITLLSLLNNKRTNTYVVEESTFVFLTKILDYIILKTLEINDFELKYKILGWCIILSQTFKCTIDGREKYIQEDIEHNEVFKSAEFWVDLCNYYIADNAYKSNNYTNFKTEIDEDDLGKIKRIAESKAMTIVHNVYTFNVAKETIDKILDEIVKTYELNTEMLNELRKVEELNKSEAKKKE